MSYELWSAKSRNLIDTYGSREHALAEVQAIVRRQGEPYAERLVLVREDEQGESVRIAAGAELIRLANEDTAERVAIGNAVGAQGDAP